LLEELWLKTGTVDFHPDTNGDSPVITPATDLGPISIRLGLRGAKILFDVRDQFSGKTLRATVSFQRVNVSGRELGVLQTATHDNGDPHFLFLPAGDYFAHIDWLRCAGRDVFPSSAGFTFSVTEGEVLRRTFAIDSRIMAAQRSSGNPNAEPCTP
jgi:hypothetical protein